LFSYVSCESRVPAGHPLRSILAVADAALAALSPDFQELYALNGRPSIAPEKLLRALLLQAFYSVRSERQLMEQLDYNLLFRWFVGLGVDDPVWDVTVFTKNRDRLLAGEIAAKFLRAVLAQPRVKALLSHEHFSVDGTLIQAWASMKSFRPKDGSEEPPAPGRNGERDFHGEQRTNDSHASITDPEAMLFRKGKGKEAKLCFMGHALMENRHGLLVDGRVSQANGTAERDVAAEMLAQHTGEVQCQAAPAGRERVAPAQGQQQPGMPQLPQLRIDGLHPPKRPCRRDARHAAGLRRAHLHRLPQGHRPQAAGHDRHPGLGRFDGELRGSET
jgi:transposase